jgi:fructan beta-fructosidase
VLAAYAVPVARRTVHHLKVVAVGTRLRVHLDGAERPAIDITDGAYGSGLYGLHVRGGKAALRNANAGLTTDLAGPWTTLTSIWTDTPAGKRGWASGDGFHLSAQSGTDFTYEGDLSLGSAVAASLTFRASADAAGHYTANINTSGGGQIKLWRPGKDLATYATPIAAGQVYHLKVVTQGYRIRVFLGDGPQPVIDATDTAYTGGLFGANVFSGAGTVQNLTATGSAPAHFATNAAGPWRAVSGSWTATADGEQGLAGGDGFYLSAQSGTDFAYEGDLRLDTADAVSLTFRANADATAHYTANINRTGGGQIKLWRPGADLGVHAAPITPGQVYHLKVVAAGPRIRVYLGDGAEPVIDVTDTAYSGGLFGANVFSGAATLQNLRVG